MKVGIHQIDGKIPNLALMQCTAYHENKGHEVEKYSPDFFRKKYDVVYASKIFSKTPTPSYPAFENLKIGGTGFDYTNRLPKEIEACKPSYSLYSQWDSHLGFSMKGCRFKCKFCVVPQKEGNPFHNSTIDELLINPNGGNRLMLLDNDFFGGPNWKQCIERIIELDLKVCFVQGLNIRIITTEQAESLAKVRFYASDWKNRHITFAWDRTYDKRLVMKGLDICIKAGIPSRKMQFFVLVGYKSTVEDAHERVKEIRSWGSLPYAMPYLDDMPNKTERKKRKAFARWVNQRAIFNSCTWEEYKYNPDRKL